VLWVGGVVLDDRGFEYGEHDSGYDCSCELAWRNMSAKHWLYAGCSPQPCAANTAVMRRPRVRMDANSLWGCKTGWRGVPWENARAYHGRQWIVAPDPHPLEETQCDEDADDADTVRVASHCLAHGCDDYNDELNAV
jgi:hypothetical protein